ncbi:MAG: hypothetical protein ACSLFP_15270 [Acidimicrobiales bacterium]
MVDPEIREPDNSTVDDWFGQNVARDQDLADELVEEEGGDTATAEDRFDDEAEGQAKYDAGHPRPSGD